MGSCHKNINKKTAKLPLEECCDPLECLFEDMPEWEGERYRGQGIKKMKGYKCDIPIDELNKIREQFWRYKISKNSIWKQIKQAVYMDVERGANYLETIKLKTVRGCINELQDKNGKLFRIPNYCINDPYFEKLFEDEADVSNPREGKIIKIKLFDFYNVDKNTYELEVDDNLTGRDLKLIFCRRVNLDEENIEDIRLFFGGGEIKDHHKLYKHNMKDEFTILVMVKNKSTIHVI